MARTKKRKVGDRIFYTDHKGNICTCLIKDIKEESDRFDKYGKEMPHGRLFKYNVYKTGAYSSIEDYNCLSDNDPRVKEFCNGKKFVTLSFVNDLRAWLESHGAHKGDGDVAEILYQLSLEYE